MRSLTFLIVLWYFLSFSPALANDDSYVSMKDSVTLSEITVTGTRVETSIRNLPMSVTVIEGKQIENRIEQSLLPIITEQVPSLFITSRSIMGYSVSSGSAGGMTIRGVGGSPTSGVLMLIDGHPQYMGLMGHPLADSYQSMMAEKVEVVRGPASVLYGSNAMGGVINIVTKKQKQDGINTGLNAMYGSYNTVSTEVHNAVRSGKFNSYASLDYNRTDGHRKNMDFEQYSGYAKVGYDFTDNWKSFVDFNLSKFSATNPGLEDRPVTDNEADVTRGMVSFSLENSYDETSGAIKLFYNFGKHKINDGYYPQEGENPRNERFRSKDNMFGLTAYQSYRFFRGNNITAGFDWQRFGGHAWNIFTDKSPDRDIIDKSINDIAGYINIQQALLDKVTLNAGIRVDHNTYTGTQWIPQAGVSYIPTNATVLKAIVSKGFRNPTIREMFMFGPQNPDLEPESLMNYELSASQKLLNNSLNLGLNLYYIKGDNSIVTQPVKQEDGSTKFMYLNTGEIENYGLEFTANYRLNRNLDLSANYSYLHMKNIVLASPEHKLYMGATYAKDKWMVATGLQYINNLYTVLEQASQNGTTPAEKESFLLWNVRASYQVSKLFQLFAKGENLLAQQYEINKGYPMPKATVFGGVNLKF